MKLETGMYVRTKRGYIAKITEISDLKKDFNKKEYRDIFTDVKTEYIFSDKTENVVKASYNVIDLIEVGDVLLLLAKEYDDKYKAEVVLDSTDFKSIVNYEQCDLLNLEYELITEEHIKLLQILTKEQFESISYEVNK